MTVTVPRTKETQLKSRLSGKEWYLSNFQSFEKSLNGAAMFYIHSIRRVAISRFAELGFPTTRDEEWKYTDVSSLARIPFIVILGDDSGQLPLNAIEKIAVAGLTPNLIVFVNG